jgi:hypothetical protein
VSAVGQFAPAVDGPATMRLGQLCERLRPLYITEAGLAALGFFPVARDRAACLYAASDFPLICAALARHLLTVQFGESRWVPL